MVLVLFFILLIILIVFSTLKINIKKLEISNEANDNIIKELKVCIGIYCFNQIIIFKKCIDEKYLEKINNSENMQKFKNQVMKNNSKGQIKNGVDIIKQINPKLEELNLKLNVGTEDVILTSFLICIISIVISIFLSKTIKKYNKEKYKYSICPSYNNKNFVKANLSGILQIKLVNIISIILKSVIKSKRKVIKRRECEQA